MREEVKRWVPEVEVKVKVKVKGWGGVSFDWRWPYNLLQATGWAVSLSRLLISFRQENSLGGAYASAGKFICFLQAVSFLEVIHGAIEKVPSGALLPLMQWEGRSLFLFAIVRRLDEVQEFPGVFTTFAAWCLIEVIRYPHYAFYCVGGSPYVLTYLRYTAFIVLYPLGAGGETWLIYDALPFIKEKNLYAEAFSFLPFSYYSFVVVLLVCYPVLVLQMYLHLLKQRNSKLGKKQKIKEN